jgi:hypothetical protein
MLLLPILLINLVLFILWKSHIDIETSGLFLATIPSLLALLFMSTLVFDRLRVDYYIYTYAFIYILAFIISFYSTSFGNLYQILMVPITLIFSLQVAHLIDKKAFVDVGGYRKEYTPAADLDLWYRMVEKGYVILSIKSYLFKYRIHYGADSTNQFMFQRKKTHFANLNMENRRSGKAEITYDRFCNIYWSNVNYRLPRMWRNYSKFYYKKAGLLYLNGDISRTIFFLLISFAINPIYVLKRLNTHVIGRGSL